jgi:hypothetical protein
MRLRALALAAAAVLALPAQVRGLRFHCLVAGRSDLPACCCTGSTTEACGPASHVERESGCGS